MRRFFAWLGRVWAVFFPPLLGAQYELEERCAKIGILLLQQIQGPDKLYWTAQLRPFADPDRNGGHRYAWTAQGDYVYEAIDAVLKQAKDYKIGAQPIANNAPKLGGRQFDPDPNVHKLEPPSWE